MDDSLLTRHRAWHWLKGTALGREQVPGHRGAHDAGADVGEAFGHGGMVARAGEVLNHEATNGTKRWHG